MPLKLNVELTEEQRSTLATIPATSWFTQVVYRNVSSPAHPHRELIENNEMKIAMVQDWIARAVPGRRVLDLFCANGAFSVMAAQAGAKEVVGLDFAEERIRCAKFVAGTIQADCSMEFRHGDVYRIGEYFKEPFDVSYGAMSSRSVASTDPLWGT